jgi:RND superfamily putative drug exporter
VLASSGTVAAGLLCLLAADLNSSRGMGPLGTVGVLCALAAMLTLLPAILVLLGRRVFWPLVPRYGSTPKARRSLFTAMGSSAGRRPLTVLAGGAVLLGALALGALNLPGTLKQEDSFTSKPDAVAAMETLGKAYPERGTQPITVITREGRAAETLASAAPRASTVRRKAVPETAGRRSPSSPPRHPSPPGRPPPSRPCATSSTAPTSAGRARSRST